MGEAFSAPALRQRYRQLHPAPEAGPEADGAGVAAEAPSVATELTEAEPEEGIVDAEAEKDAPQS